MFEETLVAVLYARTQFKYGIALLSSGTLSVAFISSVQLKI